MERWSISAFSSDGIIVDELLDDSDVNEAHRILYLGEKSSNSKVSHAISIYSSILQRSILSSLLISEDCDDEEITSITGICIEVIAIFKKIFFRIEDAFTSKIDKIDYIETGIAYYSEIDDEESLNFFLLLRWAISLGKEFIIWKYRLAPVEYSADRLYNVVMKEAFFYHKEKSMGNIDIPLSEYLRSANILLGSVKNSTTVKDSSEEDASLEILDQLDIIIEEKEAPAITLDEIDGVNFVNNALAQETT